MIKTLPITEARQKLPQLVARAKKVMDEYVITVKGRPAAMLMSIDQYEAWRETKEILSDKRLMRDIRRGEKEIKEGKGIPWEKVKKDLGWE